MKEGIEFFILILSIVKKEILIARFYFSPVEGFFFRFPFFFSFFFPLSLPVLQDPSRHNNLF